jgi:hypothetical protein
MKKVGRTARQPVKPGRLRPVIAVRVPDSIYRQMQAAAKKAGRSMSDEMAWRLGKSLEPPTPVVVSIPPDHFIRPDGQILPRPPEPIEPPIDVPSDAPRSLIRYAHRVQQLHAYEAAKINQLKEQTMQELKTALTDAIADALAERKS